MWPSIELRWFFSAQPCAANALFETLPAPETRIDWYAFPCHPHCGVKLRQGKIELKLLLGSRGEYRSGSIQGRLQRWEKWSQPWDRSEPPAEALLRASGWMAVEKMRYQQLYGVEDGHIYASDPERPGNRCQVEWAELTLQGERWWTVGFEVWGDTADAEADLRQVSETTLAAVGFERVPEARFSFGYPQWLGVQQRLARTPDGVHPG